MWGVFDEFLIDPAPEPPAGLTAFAALAILMAWRRRISRSRA
jgi:MYXO-CTERM domain-containing protein